MSDTLHTMDIEYYCQICGRSWGLHDATMANAELLFNLTESHKHSTEEIRVFMETDVPADINYSEDPDD